jgi:hypothetical protein
MDLTQASARGAATVPDDGLTVVPDNPDSSSPAGEDAVIAATADEADASGDVFSAITDEVPDTGGAARAEYLSIRGFTPVRHVLVQHIQGAPKRPSILGDLVSARQPRALLLYLLVLACEHRLAHDRRLPVLTVARMLKTAHYPCTTEQARKAIEVLKAKNLLKTRWTGTSVEMVPLFENGSGEVWDRPTGDDEDPDLQRYFALPNEFFADEVLDKLKLPGLAMLLVGLKETSNDSTYSISVERYSDWYAISERTAERGYRELTVAELTRTHRQLVKDSRMARGVRAKYHRTLLGAFSTQSRRDAQRAAAKAAKGAGRAKAGAR